MGMSLRAVKGTPKFEWTSEPAYCVAFGATSPPRRLQKSKSRVSSPTKSRASSPCSKSLLNDDGQVIHSSSQRSQHPQ